MSINVEEIRQRARVASITVSHMVLTGKKQDFVSMTLKCPDEEGWTLEEAHIAHKIVSRDAVEMAYMDALARGHKVNKTVRAELEKIKRNYDALTSRLEERANKHAEPTAVAAK